MVCIYCGYKLRVSNSRLQKRSNSIWRRRNCPACKAVITTIEEVKPSEILVYSSGQRHSEPFSRDILFISIYEACKHRKRPEQDASALTDTILSRVIAQTTGSNVHRHQLIELVTEVLSAFDKAAGTAYKAFHPIS